MEPPHIETGLRRVITYFCFLLLIYSSRRWKRSHTTSRQYSECKWVGYATNIAL